MEAHIISKKIVKPSVPTPHEHRVHKLSFFDQLAPSDHIPIIFFYNSKGEWDEKLHEKLVNSLSETLTLFYPLAGRFVEDGYYVDCNDKGAEYIEAKIDIELSEFLGVAPKNIHLLNSLVPRDSFGATHLVTTPILGLKVTTFKSGGIAICMHLSHKVADGFSAANFYHEWSITSRLRDTNKDVVFSSPYFGLASHFPARDLSKDIKPEPTPSSKIAQSKLVTKRFVFDEKSISALKNKVSDDANLSRPSRVEVVTCIIWKALIKIAASKSKRDSTLYLYLNLRGRTNVVTPPSDQFFLFGNYYNQIATKLKANNRKLEDFELHELVNLLKDNIGKSLESCSKISNPNNLFMEVARHVNEIREDLGREEVDVRFFSTLCRFPFYEVDFGWGKPEWVTTVGMPLETVFLMDTKSGTGIVAIVCLHETSIVQFENDADVIAFTSSGLDI